MKKITPQLFIISILAGAIPIVFAEPPALGAVQSPQSLNGAGLPNKTLPAGVRDIPTSTQMQTRSAPNSVGATAPNPQQTSAILNADQMHQNIEKKYVGAVNEVKVDLDSKGYVVTTTVPRSGKLKAQPSEYYVSGPNGGTLEVSTTVRGSDVGVAVQKTVAVAKPGEDTVQGITVTIDHPNAKAVKIAESNITPSAQALGDALKIADDRENVVKNVDQPLF